MKKINTKALRLLSLLDFTGYNKVINYDELSIIITKFIASGLFQFNTECCIAVDKGEELPVKDDIEHDSINHDE